MVSTPFSFVHVAVNYQYGIECQCGSRKKEIILSAVCSIPCWIFWFSAGIGMHQLPSGPVLWERWAKFKPKYYRNFSLIHPYGKPVSVNRTEVVTYLRDSEVSSMFWERRKFPPALPCAKARCLRVSPVQWHGGAWEKRSDKWELPCRLLAKLISTNPTLLKCNVILILPRFGITMAMVWGCFGHIRPIGGNGIGIGLVLEGKMVIWNWYGAKFYQFLSYFLKKK